MKKRTSAIIIAVLITLLLLAGCNAEIKRVETPTFSLAAGSYDSVQTVEIKSATVGATIYYTNDGSDFSSSSIKYTGPITLASSQTIKAIAIRDGYSDSEISSAEYIIQVAKPTFSIAEGSYDSIQSVEISCAMNDAVIYYTTDGTTPTSSSTQYTGAITVDSSQTIKAMATRTGCSNSEIASAEYTINPSQVATPTFSVAAGTYHEAQTVAISCSTSGASIHYTTDGTTPASTSTEYTGAITVSATQTIKAIAVMEYYQSSDVASAAYTIQVAAPTFSVAAGTYTEVKAVTISCSTEGAAIHYTTDGTTPTSTSTQYSSAITVASSQTIKAIAIKAGCSDSDTASAAYTIQVAAPTFTIAAGTYNSIQSVEISCATEGSTIYYTNDGTDPSSESTLYSEAISVAYSHTIKAIAIKTDIADSEISSAKYTINLPEKLYTATAYSNDGSPAILTIDNSYTGIDAKAFYNCTGLTSITIPSSVTSIGFQAFYGCTGLTRITIPSSVTSIENRAFYNCTGLTSIIVDSANSDYSSESGVLFNKDKTSLVAYPCGKEGSSYAIPSSVTSIGFQAFYGCTGLTSVTIPDSVTSIEMSAFLSCTGLTSITIPSSVTSIGKQAFFGCTGLTSITIPESVTSIGNWAFSDCTGLTSIIVDSANSYYSSEDGVLFNKDKTSLIAYPCGKEVSSYAIPSSVSSIEMSAFRSCTGLTSITIPGSVTSIGSDAFFNCRGLTSITIPASVTSIGDWTFEVCSGLTSITIPSSVTSIGEGAFRECTSLASITFSGTATQWNAVSKGDDWNYNVPATSVICTDSEISYAKYTNDDYVNAGKPSVLVIDNSYTGIDAKAFYNCTGLTSITIPSSVTSIGFQAFYGCTGLTSIIVDSANSYYTSEDGVLFNKDKTSLIAYPCGKEGSSYAIPSSVTSIGFQAFYGCTGLTSVTIPDSVTSIEMSAFLRCTGLTSITIPSSVTSIGNQAFSDCTGLTSITIPESVTSIENRAFSDCTGLTSITIPGSVTSIGKGAFRECTSLASITFSGTATQWNAVSKGDDWNYNVPATSVICTDSEISYAKYTNDDYVNAGKPSVLVIDNSYTGIDAKAFYNCTGLTSITIPSSVTSIGFQAFFGCTGLTSVTIPDSVTSIEMSAFLRCTGLTSIIVDSANSYYSSEDGVLFNKDKTSLIAYPCGKEGSSYAIPSSVTSIGFQAFYGCTGLTSITIPSSVTSIGNQAFSDCTGLTSITIPESVTSIGSDAFRSCTGLTSITIPESVTSIGNWAFCFCRGLTSITIPSSVTSIGSDAFRSCTGLTSITIPGSVTSIGNWAFSDCTGLTSITIPGSVTSIGEGAFRECTSLASITFSGTATQWNAVSKGDHWNYNVPATSVICTDSEISYAKYTNDDYVNAGKPSVLVIDNSYTGIDAKAFYNCTGLTSITIPSSVTSIGYWAFFGCTGLTSITIPSSVTSIGNQAFSDCTGLTSITIPESVTSIGNRAFSDCTGLTSITIPGSVTSIGNWAFSDCTGLTSITIPGSVTSIGNWAFSDCTGLTSITIPGSVTSIGEGAFRECTSLASITFSGTATQWNAVSKGDDWNYNVPATSVTCSDGDVTL